MIVIITSQDALHMDNITATVDTNGIAESLAEWNNVTVHILSTPQSSVASVDRVHAAINTVLSGFVVEGIVYDPIAMEWIVTVNYFKDAPNTVTSLYVTKSGAPPYSDDVLDTFFIAKHPCMKSISVCCLNDYKEDYYIGNFSDTVTSAIGACDTTVQNSNTLGMFDPANNEDLIMSALSQLDNSYVTRLDENRVQLHIHRFALRDQVSVREAVAGGYTMDFFVGMSYYTLLPANSLATVASQVEIHATATDAVLFATSSEQDYTFLDYITMALFQTKYIANLVNTHYMQFVRLGFVFPNVLTQNMNTGLVPLTSIRFAIGKSAPDVMASHLWTNPCYSESNTGLYDNATSILREQYVNSAQQECSLQVAFCQNPVMEVLDKNFVQIWLPIGDNTITDAMLENSDVNYLFVHFNIALKQNGRNTFTKLFAQAPLSQLSITRACEDLSVAQSIGDIAEVDLDIGIAGSEADWASSVQQFTDLIQETETKSIVNTGLEVHALSMESSLITIAVRGIPEVFEQPLAKPFHFEIEDMTSMHFLDSTKYNAMLQLIASGNAWSMVREEGTGFLQIALSFTAANMCLTETIPGDFTCAVRKNIFRRQVVWEHAIHPLATGVGTSDEDGTVAWLQEFILGKTDFSTNLATNFTRLSRQKHNINDRYNKAWFINPMYKWATDDSAPAQQILSLTDKTIIAAVLVLEDENYEYGSGGGAGSRRMLLQVTSDENGVQQTIRDIGAAGESSSFPPIKNNAINNDLEVARMIGINNRRWFKMRMNLRLTAPPTWTKTKLREEMQSTINENKNRFSQNVDKIHLVRFGLDSPDSPGSGTGSAVRRRTLLQTEPIEWTGYIENMVTAKANNTLYPEFSEDYIDVDIYENWMRCAFYYGEIEVDRVGSPVAECGQSTQAAFQGFVEEYFISFCTDEGGKNETVCTNVINFMQNPVQPELPTIEQPEEAANWTGYRIEITFIDDRVNTETFNAFDRDLVKEIIAEKIGVPKSQVIYRVGTTTTPGMRRLLSMLSIWDILVDKDVWDWNSIDIKTLGGLIKDAIEDDLGYSVGMVTAEYKTSTAPGPDDDDDDDDDDDTEAENTVIILLGVGMGVLALAAVGVTLASCMGWIPAMCVGYKDHNNNHQRTQTPSIFGMHYQPYAQYNHMGAQRAWFSPNAVCGETTGAYQHVRQYAPTRW